MERVALPYVQWLARMGIDARVRTVDPAQYQRLSDSYDFDMTDGLISESDSPGNEQTGFWGCDAAKLAGSDNIAGVCHPAVEAIIKHILAAPDRAALVTATHALDRVLLWNWYAVPHWYNRAIWVVHWDRFDHPQKPVRVGLALDSWWFDASRAIVTDAARVAGK
jgi:microcin C transport system substrate-binding protein